MQVTVIRSTERYVYLLLQEQGIPVPSDDVTRCDILLRRTGLADQPLSSDGAEADWFVLQSPYRYGGRQLNVVRFDAGFLFDDPPPDGRIEAHVFMFDADHPSGRFCGVVDLDIQPQFP